MSEARSRRAAGKAILLLGAMLPAFAQPASAAPSNDAFAAAHSIVVLPHKALTSTRGASTEAGEQRPCGLMGSTVWYRYREAGPSPRAVAVSSAGSNYDAVLAVYSGGPSIGSLELIDCNDDAGPDVQAMVGFVALPGRTYYVQAGGWDGDTGDLELHVTGGVVAGISPAGLNVLRAGAAADANYQEVSTRSSIVFIAGGVVEVSVRREDGVVEFARACVVVIAGGAVAECVG